MVLIGLYGGKAHARECVATMLETHPLTRVNLLNLSAVPGGPSAKRGRLLEKLGPSRAARLQQHLAGLDRRRKAAHLVVTHVETLEEAQVIRAAGGRLWYVEGVPSDVIPIRAGDLGVALRPGGHGRYLDPPEALHQEIMTQRWAQRGVI